MGLKFNLELISQWDDYNLKLCLSWKTLGKSVLCFEWLKIINLKENIANNILNILKSDQILDSINHYQEANDDYILKWLFMNCHSFALSIAIWCSVVKHGTLTQERLNLIWLERIQILKVGDDLNDLQQWDIITSDENNQYNHSIICLWKDFYNKYAFFSCNWKDWFIDYEWVYHNELNPSDFDEITQTLNWLIYVKEWYRIWWPLSIVNINQMYNRCQYHWIQKLNVYRKVANKKK